MKTATILFLTVLSSVSALAADLAVSQLTLITEAASNDVFIINQRRPNGTYATRAINLSNLVESAKASGIAWGKTVAVATNGNDALGNRKGSPFRTLTAARDASLSGDTILVFPGNYTNTPTDTTTNNINLLKNGVNWFFHDGANVYQSATNVNHSMFNDGHFFAPLWSSGITSSISGKGTFTMLVKAGTEEQDCPLGVLELWHSNSIVHFDAKTIAEANQNGFGSWCTYVRDCQYCSIRADDILGSAVGLGGVWWEHGECDVSALRIVTPGTAAFAVYTEQDSAQATPWPPKNFYVNAGLISGYGGVWCYSNGASNRVWITAQEIIATGNGATSKAIDQQGTKLYVTAQKISSLSTIAPAIHLEGGPTLAIGENCWITAQKVESPYRYIQIENAGAGVQTNWLNIQHFEPSRSGVPTVGIMTMASSTSVTFLSGQFARSTGQTFIQHNAGTLIVQGYTIQAALAAQVLATGLHMKGCTLACSGAASISAATPQTMGIYWSAANVTTNGNMTFSPNAGFTVNANVQ